MLEKSHAKKNQQQQQQQVEEEEEEEEEQQQQQQQQQQWRQQQQPWHQQQQQPSNSNISNRSCSNNKSKAAPGEVEHRTSGSGIRQRDNSQLEHGTDKQKHPTYKATITKHPFTKRAGKAGGFCSDFHVIL